MIDVKDLQNALDKLRPARSIRRIITRRAGAAGIGGRVSGHSLRVGSAQSLAAAGAGLVEMQQAADWRSPRMPAHYARHLDAARRLRYGMVSGGGQTSSRAGSRSQCRDDLQLLYP